MSVFINVRVEPRKEFVFVRVNRIDNGMCYRQWRGSESPTGRVSLRNLYRNNAQTC